LYPELDTLLEDPVNPSRTSKLRAVWHSPHASARPLPRNGVLRATWAEQRHGDELAIAMREVRDRADTWDRTRWVENETQIEFEYRNDTLYEFEDRDDTPLQV
jgi:hypothetical protein